MADTLSQALLEASLLSSIPEEDEGSVIIDVDKRTMVLPTGFFFGVYNDKDILRVPFVIPRYYNELDLSEFQITVNYINSAGYGNIYRVTDAEVTDSAIRFKWMTGRGVFVKEGTVRFIVCLRQIGSSGEVEKEFNTTIASANVLKGLEVDENPDPVAYSILAHMEELKDQAEAAVDVVEGAADRIDNAVTEAEQAIASMYHSPYVAPTAADMLSHDKVYVYTGNETGYTFGNWYYWNGSAFVSGGVYNATAFNTDDTLSVEGAAADAKKSGDEINWLKENLYEKGLSEDAKQALLACFEHLVWSGGHGRDYYGALEEALYPEVGIVRIEAISTQGSDVIYEDISLNDVKAYLVVTAFYNNGTHSTVVDFALTGEIEVGTTVITVLFMGKTDTVTITITARPVLKVFIGKGINTSGNILDNDKRALSQAIPFANTVPIKARWVGNNGYIWSLKPITTAGKVSNEGNRYSPDNYDSSVSGSLGWIYTEREQTKVEGSNLIPSAYTDTNGTLRILMASSEGTSYDLPENGPSGYMTITGTTYKVEAHDKNEFV